MVNETKIESQDKVIELRNIGVSYGRTPILHEIDLDVYSGEVIALVGANGSGKSTLLRSLIRLELANQGRGTVLGANLFDDTSKFNESIGYVSEALDFNVNSNLKKIAGLYERLRSQFSMDDFERVAKGFGLDLSRSAGEYSRGQKMQFSFALAVASSPRLLLLDEVTAVLDIHVRDLVMREVQRLAAKGATALVATNILTEVIPYANRLIIMDSGRISLDVELEELEEKYEKIKLSPDQVERFPELEAIKGSSDSLMTCLISKKSMNQVEREELLKVSKPSKDQVTAEDIFLYHCKKAS